jgi:phospholipid/cholesterol/gamma-HCH transport system permease protein
MPKRLESFFVQLAQHLYFFQNVLRLTLQHRWEWREFLREVAHIGWRSLPITLTAGVFTGAILAVQFFMQIQDFGANATLGGLNTSGTLREVGPVLIAFLIAGKVGAFTSAELGTMKVTDQMDAIRCLGVHPISFLVVPRFFAVVFCSVLLLSFGLVISVSGGILAAALTAGINPQQYLSAVPQFATGEAIFLTLSKSLVFGVFMGHLCCANGYMASGGARGVGEAVKRTAVQSMVAIVLVDFTITALVSLYWGQ